MSERLIVVEPVPGTLLAETKDEAKRIRVNELLPALERGEIVTLDFSKVGFATQSYVHALISEAIRRYGDQAFDLLRFKGCSEEVQQVVLTSLSTQSPRATPRLGSTSRRRIPEARESDYAHAERNTCPTCIRLHEGCSSRPLGDRQIAPASTSHSASVMG